MPYKECLPGKTCAGVNLFHGPMLPLGPPPNTAPAPPLSFKSTSPNRSTNPVGCSVCADIEECTYVCHGTSGSYSRRRILSLSLCAAESAAEKAVGGITSGTTVNAFDFGTAHSMERYPPPPPAVAAAVAVDPKPAEVCGTVGAAVRTARPTVLLLQVREYCTLNNDPLPSS